MKTNEEMIELLLAKMDRLEGFLHTPGGPIIHHVNKFRADVLAAIKRQDYINYSQVEAYHKLASLISNVNILPPLRGWAISPDIALMLYKYILNTKPKKVIEFGSGASTIIIAEAMKENGFGRLISVDHSETFGKITLERVNSANLNDFVDSRIKPLKPWPGEHISENDANEWYDLSVLYDCHDIEFVFVDGPPGLGGPCSRYPALPAVFEYLTVDAQIWVDDANRPDEKLICKTWAADFDLELEFVPLEKGLSCLTRKQKADSNKSSIQNELSNKFDFTSPEEEFG